MSHFCDLFCDLPNEELPELSSKILLGLMLPPSGLQAVDLSAYSALSLSRVFEWRGLPHASLTPKGTIRVWDTSQQLASKVEFDQEGVWTFPSVLRCFHGPLYTSALAVYFVIYTH